MQKNQILMPMLDGGIVDYQDDMDYIPGCETCDYGSEYINDITVTLTKHKIHAVVNNMYKHALSSGDMMKALLPAYDEIRNMTECDFATWFKNRLLELMKEHNPYTKRERALREYTVTKGD